MLARSRDEGSKKVTGEGGNKKNRGKEVGEVSMLVERTIEVSVRNHDYREQVDLCDEGSDRCC